MLKTTQKKASTTTSLTTNKQKVPKTLNKVSKRQYSKHKRYQEIVTAIQYKIPKSRIKQSKNHSVSDFREIDGSQATFPIPDTQEAYTLQTKARNIAKIQAYQDHLAAGGAPRVYSLRKQYLYKRNRERLEKASAILVIQPGSDPEFYEIMDKLGDSWTTAHFRNGLVHVHDKPYAKLKEFFKGPIRVLLQDDPNKVLPSYKKLLKVLQDHPNTLFLGGSIDGFAGVAKDFEDLKKFDSKLHVQGQIIQTLNVVNSLIPALEYPTKSFAQLVNHHEKELQKTSV